MKPSGAHTHPGMGGGGKALVVLAVIVGAAIAEPVARAVGNIARVTVEAFDVFVIVVATTVSLAVIAWLVYFVARLRRRYVEQLPLPRSQHPVLVSQEPAPELPNRAVPRAALHGNHLRAAQLAAGADPVADTAPAVDPSDR